jgi:hypothetical protein
MKVNTISLNSVRLNTIALNHIGEIRSGGGGSKPSPIPQWIREHVVFWYDVKKQGATNETLKESAYLQDLSGKGRRMKLNNFLFNGMSGIDGYKNMPFNQNKGIEFETIHDRYVRGKLSKSNGTGFGFYYVQNYNGNILHVNWHVEGIKEGNKVYVKQFNTQYDLKIELHNGDNQVAFDITDSPSPNYRYITLVADQPYSTDITITQIPEYPGALVTDGVDDYGLVENLSSGVKMLFMTVNPLVIHKCMYDQRSNTASMFSVANIRDRVAYVMNLENTELDKKGRIYIDGVRNTSTLSQELLNIKQVITACVDSIESTKTPFFFNTTLNGAGWYSKLAFYNSIAFDSIPTEADGFTEQELIDYVLTNIIGQ